MKARRVLFKYPVMILPICFRRLIDFLTDIDVISELFWKELC